MQAAAHIYGAAGKYTVRLIATDAKGCSDTFTLSQPVKVITSPTAAFAALDLSGCKTPIKVPPSTSRSRWASFYWRRRARASTCSATTPSVDAASKRRSRGSLDRPDIEAMSAGPAFDPPWGL